MCAVAALVTDLLLLVHQLYHIMIIIIANYIVVTALRN